MRRLSALMVAVAATFSFSSANALVLVVDTFNAPNVSIFDTMGGDATAATYSDAIRTINQLQVTAGANAGFDSNLSIGNDSTPDGNLQIRNADTVTSDVTMQWGLAPGFVPATGPLSLYFKVYKSDDVTKTVNATVNITNVGTFVIGDIDVPTTLSFAIGAAQQAALFAGGTLGMTITGVEGWDLSIDEIGFVIPEPSALALVGLGLLGAGLASRRRKA